MNQPKIKFFTSSVGESIAYAVHGAGPYLVVPAWWVSHLELDWQSEDYRHFFEALAEHHTIVRYDRPGTGLSNRQRVSFELEDEVKILAELIEHIGIKNCSLLGISCGGPAAVVYAHRYPHRIDKLVFIGSFVDGNDIGNDDIQQALCTLVLAHWGVGAKAIIDLFDPDMITEQRKLMGKTHKNSASSNMASSLLKLTFEMDVKETAKKLIKPTLVLHRNKDKTVPMDAGRQLAAMIPNAEFKSIEGRAHLPWIGVEAEQFVKAILSFTEAYQLPNKINVNQFICSGDFWTLSYKQKTVHIKDMLGLHDLASLIENPGQELHVRFLATGENGSAGINTNQTELLDKQALKEYRKRLAELKDEKIEASQAGDDGLYQDLEQEQDALNDALTQALGLSGRQREFSSDDERARKSISARIRSSIERIGAVHPALAEHFNQSIRTGQFCSYNAPSDLHWQTRG